MLHRIPIVVNDPWENYNPYANPNRKGHHTHPSTSSKPRTVEPVTLAEIKDKTSSKTESVSEKTA